jgi:hypothetical protein
VRFSKSANPHGKQSKVVGFAMRVALALILAAPLVGAAPSAPASAPTASAIIGRYECVTEDSRHRTWRFISTNVAWGAWLRADTSLAAQNGSPSDTGTSLVGFDPRTKRWNWISFDTDGTYDTRSSISTRFNGSRWNDGYPADGGTAIITVANAKQYWVDFTAPAAHGTATHSRVVCTRR